MKEWGVPDKESTIDGLRSYYPIAPFDLHPYIERCIRIAEHIDKLGIPMPSPMIEVEYKLVGFYWTDHGLFATLDFDFEDNGKWGMYVAVSGPDSDKDDVVLNQIPYSESYVTEVLTNLGKAFTEKNPGLVLGDNIKWEETEDGSRNYRVAIL